MTHNLFEYQCLNQQFNKALLSGIDTKATILFVLSFFSINFNGVKYWNCCQRQFNNERKNCERNNNKVQPTFKLKNVIISQLVLNSSTSNFTKVISTWFNYSCNHKSLMWIKFCLPWHLKSLKFQRTLNVLQAYITNKNSIFTLKMYKIKDEIKY